MTRIVSEKPPRQPVTSIPLFSTDRQGNPRAVPAWHLDLSGDPKLRRECRIPDDVVAVRAVIRFEHPSWPWHGYSMEVVGAFKDGATPPTLVDAPVVWVEDVMPVLALRRRGRYGDSPLYVEACWSPGRGSEEAIRGLQHKHTVKDLQRAHQGLGLLRASGGPGRPLGSTSPHFETPAECEKWFLVHLRYAKSKQVRMSSLSLKQFAAWLTDQGVEDTESPETMKYWLRINGLRWNPLKQKVGNP